MPLTVYDNPKLAAPLRVCYNGNILLAQGRVACYELSPAWKDGIER